ncbi:MAG: aspartate aminotransferase family protein [Oligoflexales bacterium]
MHFFDIEPKSVPPINTKHRTIKSPYPSAEIANILKKSFELMPNSMNDQLPIVWDKASGYKIFDRSGNQWIDLTSTIFVANIGHAHPRVTAAINRTAEQGLLNAYNYPTEIRNQLAERITSIAPKKLNQVIFLSTGSESTEAAIKIMTINGAKINPKKKIIAGFEGSFHGKTMGSQMLGGKHGGKAWIGYQNPNFVTLPYPYPWVLKDLKMSGHEFFHYSIRKVFDDQGLNIDDIAGFMAESYQGWCAIFFPKDYISALRQWTIDHECLLAFDEVQAGFGRTGKYFGFDWYDVNPDLICCGKALSSSIPVSAVIGPEHLLNLDPSLNSTHGGNPVGMAASIAVLDVIHDEDLLSASRRKGEIISNFLSDWTRDCEYIDSYYGQGAVWGIFLKKPGSSDLEVELVDKAIEQAMLRGVCSIRTCSGTFKLGPPINIPDDALVESLTVLRESLDYCINGRK